jgi:hypothetical protein
MASVLLVGCGSDDEPTASTGSTGGVGGGGTEVTVTVEADVTSAYTLTCDPTGGDHPDADAACAALLDAASQEPSPLDAVPAEQLCTEIYGGDQTAVIEGTVDGAPVSAELSRVNGCEISRWDALLPVLVEPGGVDD